VLRALALIEAPLHQVLDALTSLRTDLTDGDMSSASDEAPAFNDAEAFGKAHLSGVARPMALAQQASREAQRPRVTVRVLWPSHWQEADREAATAWLQSQCGGLLDWVATVQAHAPAWQATPLAQAESLWAEIDQHPAALGTRAAPRIAAHPGGGQCHRCRPHRSPAVRG
jgi:hypothetical protein